MASRDALKLPDGPRLPALKTLIAAPPLDISLSCRHVQEMPLVFF